MLRGSFLLYSSVGRMKMPEILLLHCSVCSTDMDWRKLSQNLVWICGDMVKIVMKSIVMSDEDDGNDEIIRNSDKEKILLNFQY